jgi:hypothetical protein
MDQAERIARLRALAVHLEQHLPPSSERNALIRDIRDPP